MSQSAGDAAFFDLVHSVLKKNPNATPERRGCERHSYDSIQLVAPYDGKKLPSQSDFSKVHCQNLSRSGFSFYCRQIPQSPFVIIALGAIPFNFYVAQIMNSKPVVNNGMTEQCVGCRLIKRIPESD